MLKWLSTRSLAPSPPAASCIECVIIKCSIVQHAGRLHVKFQESSYEYIYIYIYSVTGMKEARHTHYRNPDLCRVPESLPSAFYRALGKEDFAESRTRQRPALGKELVYRVQDTQHSVALSKDSFAEHQTLGKDGSRQRFVSGCLQLTSVSLC
jgi:hypothetical protein